MKQITRIFTVALFALVLCSCGYSGSGSDEDVYITPYGKRYHHSWCRTIQGHKIKCVSVERAEMKGRTPCHVCY